MKRQEPTTMDEAWLFTKRVLWSVVCVGGALLALRGAESAPNWWSGLVYVAGVIGWLGWLAYPPAFIKGRTQ